MKKIKTYYIVTNGESTIPYLFEFKADALRVANGLNKDRTSNLYKVFEIKK